MIYERVSVLLYRNYLLFIDDLLFLVFNQYYLRSKYVIFFFNTLYIMYNVSQVRDLTDKVETLRVKRMQDKEKMKDFEKTKLQIEQLLEFKTKVMESQVSKHNMKFIKKRIYL